jgi:hypothetical protein
MNDSGFDVSINLFLTSSALMDKVCLFKSFIIVASILETISLDKYPISATVLVTTASSPSNFSNFSSKPTLFPEVDDTPLTP